MFDWTDEAIDRLKILWTDGLSCSQIATKMNSEFSGHVTRNAIIGKAMRLKLSSRQTGNRKPQPVYKPQRKRPFTPVNPSAIEKIAEAMPPSRLDPRDIPMEQRKQLFDLEPHHCRWPYGDVGREDYFFCGDTKVEGRSYCAAHCWVARGASTSSLRTFKG